MIKLTFSGHESFNCKDLWLKKGYDYVNEGGSFRDDNAVVDLGVGKNMVSSIRYWLRAFNIVNDDIEICDWSHNFFADDGYDPYIENIATLWILHYKLLTTRLASLYHITFSDFQKEYREFTPDQLLSFIKRSYIKEQLLYPFNENTVKRDINVLLKNYVKPVEEGKSIEDFSSLLIDLNLISESHKEYRRFKFNYNNKSNLAPEIALFIILDMYGGKKIIDFHSLSNLFFSFCITSDDLIAILEDVKEKYSDLVFSEDSGIRQIQLRSEINKWQILHDYYNSIKK